MKKCTIIINPNSGNNCKKIDFTKLKKLFLEYDYDISVNITQYKNHAFEIASSVDTDLIISVGGDGTFNEVMSGNFKREKRVLVSHIPIGTANDIGAMYGYTKSIYKNIMLLLNGEVKKIDICMINNHPFTYVAALGKFTNISYDTPRYLKKKFGYFAYLIEGLKELNKAPQLHHIKYEIDGNIYEGKYSCILISNANRIAGINNFYNNIKLDDHLFEILFCELKDKKEVLRALYQLKNGDISTCEGFKFYKTDNLKITFNSNISKEFSVDGEKLNDKGSIFEVKIIPNIAILIPKKNIKKLFVCEV